MEEAGAGGTTLVESMRGPPMMGASILLHRGRLDGGEWAYLAVQLRF